MRLTTITLGVLIATLAASGGVAEPASGVLCRKLGQAPLPVSSASKSAALGLLGSVTQMLSPLGRPVLASDFTTTVAINNKATPQLQAQALVDAFITNENAYTLADGLGATMAAIYRAKALYESRGDGAQQYCGEIAPSVTALISAVNATSRGDASAGKLAYAEGPAALFPLPPNGSYDVIGKAYGHEAGSPGADPHGNSRPFQTAPLGTTSGPRIETYDGKDFFGVATNSRLMLTGPNAADTAAGRTGSNLADSPSYPSGHTTFGYTEALILAMMVPERYRALAYRGSEYGNSRIVIGAHYPIDVISGRTLATYDLAHDLAGTSGYAQVPGLPFRTALAKAATDLRTYLNEHGCPSIGACAAHAPIVRSADASVFHGTEPQPATTRQAYAYRLTYGLPAMGADTRPPDPVPPAAARLLETRFPYLTSTQRLDVLRSTEGPSGHFLDVDPLDGTPLAAAKPPSEAGVYSRLDLYAAAGGYGSVAGQVIVDQEAASIGDPDLRPFLDIARADTWSNDIGGPGGLTKQGSGVLTLSGANTYVGPTIVSGGTLVVTGSLTSPTRVEAGGRLSGAGTFGDVAILRGGTLAPGAGDGSRALKITGALALAEGAVYVASATPMPEGSSHIARQATIEGAHLVVTAATPMPAGRRLTILTARGGVRGTFADIAIVSRSMIPKLTYTRDAVYLTLDRKPSGHAP